MKVILSLSLLIVFTCRIVGYFPSYLFHKWEMGEQLEQFLRSTVHSEKVTELIINDTEYANISWQEEKEFIFHGDLFDLIRIEKGKNGNLHLFCFQDSKEKKIRNELNENEQNNNNNPPEQKQISNISSDFTSRLIAYNKNILNTFLVSMITYRSYESNLTFVPLEIPYPPPKTA